MKNIFKNKTILVTGGTGSIGSEIVEQLLQFNPKQIRILDIRETEMFHMQHKLKEHSNVLRFLIGDIRDKERINMAMENVNIVFHAAALKHVPFCEYNPFEAVKTNVYGTQNVIETSLLNNVERVINISTDKVVNAINTMGATKLLSERLIAAAQYYKGKKKTIFSSVRFGNVIDSRGSVIDLFKTQIRRNEPITVTDLNMTRFIMSIHQAVTLVLETAEEMRGGEIFILKMPSFKLVDLVEILKEEFSKKYNSSSKNIKIKTIGLRPGEKMHENLMTDIESNNAIETNKKFIILSGINTPYFKEEIKYYSRVKKTSKKKYLSNDTVLTKKQLKRLLIKEQLI